MSQPFVNLHTHSHYTILEAPFAPKAILKRAQDLGHTHVAITDRGNMHGVVEFYQAAHKSDGPKPIIGVELALAPDGRFEKRPGVDGKEGTIVLLAQSYQGFQNLVKLVSKAQLEGFCQQPRVDFELLAEHQTDLVCLTGSTQGYIGQLYEKVSPEKATEEVHKLKEIFGDRFYLELVSRHLPTQIELNKWKAELAIQQKFQTVVTSDARYATRDDEMSAEVFYCIGKNATYSDPYRDRFTEKNWFKSWDEIAVEMSYLSADLLQTARANTVLIAESVDIELSFDNQLLPEFAVPDGHDTASWLRACCEKAISERYDFTTETRFTRQDIVDRLDYELSIIGKMGFEAYFLIVADFIQFARDNGISVGPGRGSAAGSLVSYLMTITDVDPIGWDLLFERFLNPERISMPDIDIDFSDERREEVMDYVVEKYGTEKVSKVCTFGTLAAKAALKDVGRALGMPFAEMNNMTKLLPNKPGFSLDDAQEVKEFMSLLDSNPEYKRVYDTAHRLEGSVRHVSVHACAVIIGKTDLTDHAPVQWAPGTDDVKITQLPYQQLEDIGLLKMDFLGLKNLTILEKTLQNIQKSTGQRIDIKKIPMQDPKTFAMLSEGETTGVFQFESAGMRRYLRELRPTEVEDLVAMNALYRPGPMEYIPDYIKGKHEPETVTYMDPSLEPILRKTYGIAVYQEQVLRIAQDFAGFTLGQADILRKAIGKKIAHILDEQRTKFIEGAIAKGHTEKLAVKIFDDIIVPFSGYGFNRSHAVCYALIAYETAYLRANYPAEFMAAMMTTDRNNTDRIVLEMNECQSMGIEVLPPSVNESDSFFTVVEGTENKEQTKIEESETDNVIDSNSKKGSLRFGLTAIKGLGEETVEQIIAERSHHGNYTDLQDFAKRVPAKLMNKKTLEALAFSGAFDAFGDRRAIVESLDELAKFAREHQEKDVSGQIGLFGGSGDEALSFTLKKAQATKDDILKWERESLGLFVSDHPLKGLGGYFAKHGRLIGALTEEEDKGKKQTLHGIVTSVRRIVTRAGKNMMIFELEDTSGKIECAIFPMKFDSLPTSKIEEDSFLKIDGKIEYRDGNTTCIVDAIKIGDLVEVQEAFSADKDIQKSASQAKSDTEEVSENKTDKLKDLFIVVPDGTLKETVDDFKKLLIQHKTPQGTNVQITIKGQTVSLPFKINVVPELTAFIDQHFKK